MIGFTKIVGGAPSSVSALGDHLRNQTLPQKEADVSAYYHRGMNSGMEEAQTAEFAPVLRTDIHPIVAAGLGIDVARPLRPDEINGLIAGRTASGDLIAGKKYAKVRSRGKDPKTGEDLTSTPIGSYDFCPSPDKSVSVAWAFAPAAERALIYEAHISAAREAVAYIAEKIGVAHAEKDGEVRFEPGHIGWMEFTHFTARRVKISAENGTTQLTCDNGTPGDPDVHTHFLIPNAVFCESGRVGSLHTGMIEGFIFEADGFYQARLAQKLNDAGFTADLDAKTKSARMIAVPYGMTKLFSKRSNVAEALARQQAANKNIEWDTLSAQQQTLWIRSAASGLEGEEKGGKDDVADVANWKMQAAKFGWEPKTFLMQGPPAPELTDDQRRRIAYETSLQFVEHDFEHKSVLKHWSLRDAANRGGIHSGFKGVEDTNAVMQMMREEGVRQSGEQTALIWGHEEGARHVSITTALHEREEREFIALAQKLSADRTHAVPRNLLDKHIAASGLTFDDDHGRSQLAGIYRSGDAGRFHLGIAAAGAGKAQPDYAMVLTPTGFRLIGDLVVGSLLRCPDGSIAPVIGVFPQGEKEVYRVTFEDGRSTECCGDHLWKVWVSTGTSTRRASGKISGSGFGWNVESLLETMERYRLGQSRTERIAVPLAAALAMEFPPADLPIAPYALGALLGDGHFADCVSLTTADHDILNAVLAHLPDYKIGKVDRYSYFFTLKDGASFVRPKLRRFGGILESLRVGKGRNGRLVTHGGVTRTLREWSGLLGVNRYTIYTRIVQLGWSSGQALGLESAPFRLASKKLSPLSASLLELGLRGARSHNKFVPEAYKRGSVQQRLEILRGLMDTDGSIDAKGTSASFSSTSERLARDVQELVWSLGGRAKIRERHTRCTYKGVYTAGRPSWRVNITHPDVGQFFSLPRKKDIAKPSPQWVGRLRIAKIASIGVSATRCIAVDHPDHLYVTDDYIVTHNTTGWIPLVAAKKEMGAQVFGGSLAWEQADDLVKAGIDPKNLKALSVLIDEIPKLKPGPGDLVAVDEWALLGTRQGLQLLRLADHYGFGITSLGDPKQCNSVAAGNIVNLVKRALPEEVFEIETTRRQETDREKQIVSLLRKGEAKQALDMKRADGLAEMVPGDAEKLIARTAELYMTWLKETGKAPSVAAPTNYDAHRISVAIRERRQAEGMIEPDVKVLKAGDNLGRHYGLAIAPGDRVRLFKSTGARFANGRGGNIGRNRTSLEVLSVVDDGILARNVRTEKVGFVAWESLIATCGPSRGRMLLAYADCKTINSAQGSDSDDHILALPNGSKGINGLSGYSGGTRHKKRLALLTSDAAERLEIVKRRPLNDTRVIDLEAKWANVARNLSYQPEKDLAVSMLDRVESIRRGATDKFRKVMKAAEATGKGAVGPRERIEPTTDTRASTIGLNLSKDAGVESAPMTPDDWLRAMEQADQAPPPEPEARGAEAALEPEARGAEAALEPGPAGAGPSREPAVTVPPELAEPPAPATSPRPERQERRAMSEADIQTEFANRLEAIGLRLPGPPIMDGQKHTVPVEGNKKGRKSGWYRGFADGRRVSVAGNSFNGQELKWRPDGSRMPRISAADQEKRRLEAQAAARAQEDAQYRKELAGAATAEAIWAGARPARTSHPYLERKGIKPGGLKQAVAGQIAEMNDGKQVKIGGRLLIPMRDIDGKLWNIQMIARDGGKMFLPGRKKGLFTIIGKDTDPSLPFMFSTGYATADTLHNTTALRTVVAFDDGNLLPVVKAVHEKHPNRDKIIAGDNDHHKPGVAFNLAADESGSLAVTWPTGATGKAKDGNTVEYRLAGASDWSEAARRTPETTVEIRGLIPDARYEVRVFSSSYSAPQINGGVKAAQEAAAAVGGRAVIPPFALADPGTDWNDLEQQAGRAAAQKILSEQGVPISQPVPMAKAGAPTPVQREAHMPTVDRQQQLGQERT